MAGESERCGFASLSLNGDNYLYVLSCISRKMKRNDSGKALGLYLALSRCPLNSCMVTYGQGYSQK